MTLAPLLTVPTVQVLPTNVPCPGVADISVKPAGGASVSMTFVAVFVPLFLSVTVKVIVSPTFGAGWFTVLVT